jgi:MFS transporter, AAHS family, 4-hydroxybenzoate transporter
MWAAAFVYLIGHAGASIALLGITITCAGIGIIGGQNASHALSSEFYPTRIRSTGVGWALGIGRIGSIVGPVLGGILLSQGTQPLQVFWAAVIPALVAAAAAATIGAMQLQRPALAESSRKGSTSSPARPTGNPTR